jgi:hypothetical protein
MIPTPIADYPAFYAVVTVGWINYAIAAATAVAVVLGIGFALLRVATGNDAADVGSDSSD